VQYEEDDAWLSSLAQRSQNHKYIRERANLDYTPYRISSMTYLATSFLAIPEYARIATKFGLAM